MKSGSNHIPKQEEGYEKKLVTKIASYLSEHIHESLKVSDVAAIFKLSTSTIQRLFKNHLHQTFQHYLEDMRMTKAMNLVKQGLRIKEVMYATGYKYRSTFNKAFLKKYNHPPGYFRN